MISAIVVYLNVSYTSPLIAWKREKDVMISAISGGLVNLIMNIILIPEYGIYGAAISALTGELVICIVLVFFFYKVTGKLYFGIFFKMLLLSGVAGAAGYAGMQLGLGSIISGIITITAFILINFVMKTVTISELKGYFGK